jgi:hypothetical protein
MARKSNAQLTRGHRQTFDAFDSRVKTVTAEALLVGARGRDVAGQSARLAEQFLQQNDTVLSMLGVRAHSEFDGSRVRIAFECSTTIGAVPLRSPVTGRCDYGLLVRPRFEWAGIGTMLSQMGWRVVPQPLDLSLLPQSDRRIPRWLLASIVLLRVERLLSEIARRFEFISEVRSAPKGRVDWTRYATTNTSRARLLSVPCTFPDLRDDALLKAAIRFTLAKQRESLATQRSADTITSVLMDKCDQLTRVVQDVPPRRPSARELTSWFRVPLRGPSFREGIRAIEWTVDERGLAGLSDLQGLPWSMPMEAFFEAWVEAALQVVARQFGGTVRTGRQRQTVTPLSWEPPYIGSQKSLVPDVILDRGDVCVIVDAKYKEHFDELQARSWHEIETELRERHRADLLQVLAYANVVSASRVVVCLAYPCSSATWASLGQRDRLFHRASVTANNREIHLLLTALPMGERLGDVVRPLIAELRRLEAS